MTEPGRSRLKGAAAAGAAAVLLLSACSGGGGDDDGAGGEAARDMGVEEIVRPSDEQGGTLRFAHSDEFDSVDPGDTYYAASLNFSRFYARTLVTYAQAPGEAGQELVPDLAEDLGQVSEDGLTWTYTLKEGLRFEDGTPITSEDVKYAVARSNYALDVLSKGPKYFNQYLDAGDYAGPYEDDNLDNFEGITTPDDRTIEFHLKEPFAEFDYLAAMPQTAPVPADADTGDQYFTQVVSSGPYRWEDGYTAGQGGSLVRNEEYDPDTDPLTRNRPDRIEFQVKQEANDLDQRLLSGEVHVDAAGAGVQTAARATILQNEQHLANSDNPLTAFTRYFVISPSVEPFDDKACREAIMYAADKVAIQTGYGGPTAGEIATSLYPPTVPGYEQIDPYGTPDHEGDPDLVRQKLEECGHPDGFSTNISVRSDRDYEVAAGEALQQTLREYGIETEIKGYPAGSYTSEQAGSPDFVAEEELGIMIYAWGPDWNSGFGFFSQILHGDAIAESGNSNLAELDEPEINSLIDEAIRTEDAAAREEIYREVDRLAMETATMLPTVTIKALLYRPESLTNVYVTPAWDMYDYSALGVAQE
ncbi:ABC transporter substrate-binding protein [Streptomonospora nanhaiensis]|uniref:Peptide/nickel transport system substrate-binding protein n=1 Tax=Streptomonospora nanhaiensis TaxID=1323731 RepID=A0A853BH95_9ACTN|nr:ABC transporter substrate-binding protein [Streptomonospora nanhaiensis]MBV2367005.1 ABC transporter substrate-binding protein [Streptomonospora nanhaiensis]MBX9387790.1 ABC transporter substrate-binding protein [Streptomonospora nanhaiensis]NYI93982.1 peptide/nickel transport system substrate-binding protein [Streptomonospora nanhaiensis]